MHGHQTKNRVHVSCGHMTIPRSHDIIVLSKCWCNIRTRTVTPKSVFVVSPQAMGIHMQWRRDQTLFLFGGCQGYSRVSV